MRFFTLSDHAGILSCTGIVGLFPIAEPCLLHLQQGFPNPAAALIQYSGIGVRFLPAAILNGLRRETAEALDGQPCGRRPLQTSEPFDCPLPIKTLDYKANVANSLARGTYRERGAEVIDDAYELAHPAGAELMRSKYCIRFELGLCPRFQGAKDTGPLFLLNNGRRLELGFDCRACEMTVR